MAGTELWLAFIKAAEERGISVDTAFTQALGVWTRGPVYWDFGVGATSIEWKLGDNEFA